MQVVLDQSSDKRAFGKDPGLPSAGDRKYEGTKVKITQI